MIQLTLIGIALACGAGYFSREQSQRRTTFTVLCILLAVGSIMTLPLLDGVRVIAAMLIAYALTIFAFKRDLSSSDMIRKRDVQDMTPEHVNVVFTDTTSLSDLLPTAHLSIAAKAGAGLTTFLAMVARAAHAEDRPVMVISRDRDEGNRAYAGVIQDENFVLVPMSQLYQEPEDMHADLRSMWMRVEAFSHKPGAVILFDTIHTSDDAEKVLAVIKNGGCVISSSHRSPQIITAHTTMMSFADATYPSREGLFTPFKTINFQVGEAVMLTPGQIAKKVKIEIPAKTA